MALLSALTDIWNNAAIQWSAIKMNVTDSASGSDSLLLDLQVNGAQRATVAKGGEFRASAGTSLLPGYSFLGNTNSGLYSPVAGRVEVVADGVVAFGATSTSVNFALPASMQAGSASSPSITTAGRLAGAYFPTPTAFSIATVNEERVRVNLDGNVFFAQFDTATPGAGNTTEGACLESTGRLSLSSSDNPVLGVNRNTTSGGVVAIRRDGMDVGSISVSGSTTTYNTTSDYRIKDRSEPPRGYDIDLEFARLSNALTWFAFKSEPGVHQLGWMAHEFGESVPLGVTGKRDAIDENGAPILQQIDQSKAIPLIVARMGFLVQQVANLEAQLAELRGDE